MAFISIHQPRSEAGLGIPAVKNDARDEMKITQPCAIDNEHAIVERFENQFVPAFYVFDRAHRAAPFSGGRQGIRADRSRYRTRSKRTAYGLTGAGQPGTGPPPITGAGAVETLPP